MKVQSSENKLVITEEFIFDQNKLPADPNNHLKKCLNDRIHTEQITSSSLVVLLKLKCLLKKPTHDDIIEAKEVYIHPSFGRYKGS